MTPAPSADYLERFSEALVSEIKAEMGRRDLSARGLAALIGVNPQYVTMRIGAGNPRTGKRVEINVADLAAIAGAMNLDPVVVLRRAQAAASSNVVSLRGTSEVAPTVDDLDEADYDVPSAAAPHRRDPGTGDENA